MKIMRHKPTGSTYTTNNFKMWMNCGYNKDSAYGDDTNIVVEFCTARGWNVEIYETPGEFAKEWTVVEEEE